MSHLLEVKNLGVKFNTDEGRITAVENVSFSVDEGKVLGIVGESGSGKSTIANAIINLIDPPGQITGGTIKIDNSELQNNEEIIQQIRGKGISLLYNKI